MAPEVISRKAFMTAIRDLGIDPSKAMSMTITYDGVELTNFVFNGQNKVLVMGKDGDLTPETETLYIRFVD
jgi:hypothetical protein